MEIVTCDNGDGSRVSQMQHKGTVLLCHPTSGTVSCVANEGEKFTLSLR